MAKKSKKREFKGLQDIRSLWNHLPVGTWLDLLKEIAPEYKWEQTNINTITGLCPNPGHDDKDPSFKLFFNKKYAKCYGCQYFVDDIVNIISKLRNTNYSETLIFLHNKYDLGRLITEHENDLIQYNRQQEMKKEAAIAMRRIISELIRDNPSYLQYLKPGLAYLTKGRQLSFSALGEGLPVGLLGKPEHLKKYISSDYHEEFDNYFGPVINNSRYIGSIVFHYNDSPGSISKFKIRKLDNNYVKSIKTDFMELSQGDAVRISPNSSDSVFIKDEYYNNYVGLYGMYHFKYHMGLSDANLYITEGEFDVLSIMNAQIENDSQDFIILGTCGTGSVDIAPLSEYGIRVVWVVPDHPSKNGDHYANTFLKRADKYNNHNMKIKIFTWPNKLKGGDLDDIVQNHGYDTVREYLHVKRNSTFLDAVYWIEERTDTQIDKIKEKYASKINDLDTNDIRQKQAIEHDQKQEILGLLTDKLSNLPTSADKLIFMDKYRDKEGIDLSKVDEATTAAYNLKTFEGVKERIKLTLNEYLVPAYYSGDNEKDWRLYLWSKQEKRVFGLSLQAKTLNNMFASFIKKTPVSLLDNILGDSPILHEGCPDSLDEDNVLKYQKQKEQNTQMLLTHTLYDMAQNVPNVKDLDFKGQGVHFVYPRRDCEVEEGIIYFVNGEHLFKGTWNEKEERVEWVEIDNCVDNNIKFGLDKSKKWSFVKDVSDLYQANTVDIHSLYERMLKVVDAWKVEYHETHRKFLALNIMSYTIQTALSYVNILYIVGDPESGKTTFINGLLSGNNSQGMYSMVPLLEAGKLMTSPTVASLRREGHEATLPIIIDECGSPDGHPDSPAERRGQEYRDLYMNTPMGGAQSSAAYRDDQESTITYVLHHPVIMASPSKTTDDMFLSRAFLLYFVRDPGRVFPGTYLREHFSKSELETLRKELTVAMLPILFQLKKMAPEVNDYVCSDSLLRFYERFFNTNTSPLTIYSYMGYDPKEFAAELLGIHQERLDTFHDNSQAMTALDIVLNKETVNLLSDTNSSSWYSPQSLIYGDEWDVLNSEQKGVYYIPEKNWIIVYWKQAKVKILHNTKQAVLPESKLREMASKTDNSITVSKEEHEFIKNELGLYDIISRSQYSVLSGKAIGKETNPEIEKNNKEEQKKKFKLHKGDNINQKEKKTDYSSVDI